MPHEILITEEQISRRVRELGEEISRDFQGETVHLIGVLKGAYVFLADLARSITVPVTVDFIALSSYRTGKTSSGEVQLIKDLDDSLQGKHVIVVEDIADTGLTLSYLVNTIRARDPASLKVAAFLSKPSRREIDVEVHYVGFEVEDRFVIGYGLDYDAKYRNLPHIAALD